jgi:hypothetical protein
LEPELLEIAMQTEPVTEGEADESSPKLEIVAYSAWGFKVPLVPAFFKRDWMDATAGGFAYHCLPMTLANQSGWFVLAPHGAVAEWNGGMLPTDLKVTIEGKPDTVHAMSAVGSGILTWTINYVFRTPPGWNLLCRGPANYIKDGIQSLEGLIETDWSNASFSANWKMTRPGRVEFQAGEPVAMLVPQQRGDLESFSVRKAELASNQDLNEGYTEWVTARTSFLAAQRAGDAEAIKKKYQKHYFSGQTLKGMHFDAHQKKRRLKTFES